ncbi:hypothetical protein F0562_021137 [Nyssa sinensis]|uniref:Cupin type-1 domain-containing protein n=1 Tax=Nyssa sinensis TaxID=561372 RepID=A0A5J5BL38_9ASTE|nr:hypothetical protein F0562_021137 [Nyssa sinensis]
MATKLLLLATLLSVLVSVAVGQGSRTRLSEAQQCRLQGLSASQPSQRIESEGGTTELWNENEDQFRCAGVAPMRNTLRPNGLSLPNFHPSPRLVYIERGQGLISISYPGCAETFHSEQSSRSQEGRHEEEQQQGRRRRDQHQKVHRIRKGDIVALPAGAAHWCFNDGNEELVAISITDLNHQANQLDQRLRAFYLAGRPPRQGQHSQQQAQESFQNIFNAFDEELMAEAFNIPVDLVKKMQREDERGLIVNAREMMSLIRPDENDENEEEEGKASNGLEETLCTMRIHQNIDNRRQADVYARQAGSLSIVNQHKLPILRYMDLSAEKGNLLPNALYTPHWSMRSHSIVYVLRGEAQVQVVGSNGQTVMNDRTSGSPMKSPLAGYTSVFRAMPLDVITNSYQMSPNEAQDLKLNRGGQTFLLSPRMRS